MLQDVMNNKDTIGITDYQKKEYLLEKMKKRFFTYGYQQVQTSTFEQYDLYRTITGTIPPEEMIKVIDPSGEVLVLRPDVTIPITRMIATSKQANEERLFYTSNVYRNSGIEQEKREQTQAGVESFGPNTAALDAEVITLAIHILQDIGFKNFKLEIGHAGFFKELLNEIDLSGQQISQLQALIQAKNFSAVETFLEKLPINKESKQAIQQIPLLYGKPEKVIERAKGICLNEQMGEKLANMIDIFEVLKFYDVERYISFDLGLINHMNYYSDVIFQGFVDNYGKPVLMGGRYDELASQFDAAIPAIGFACNIDNILAVMEQQSLIPTIESPINIAIYYTKAKQQEALAAAQALRIQGQSVLTGFIENLPTVTEANSVIRYEDNRNLVIYQNNTASFFGRDELLNIIKGGI